jgi:FAD/FMN-containing dehydrogenase/Fe-S oxidoreductase
LPDYNKRQLISALQQRLKGEVRFDPVSRMLYRTDASIYELEPEGVVIPEDAADVAIAVEIAGRFGVPVLPRGGGTSLAGQSVGRALHLDLSKRMNQVLEVNEAERWVRVQPGVVLDELNAQLKPRGLMLGPDVATSSRANIGGMIGNNSSGTHSILYGKTVDHLLELQVVLADGSQVRLGPVDEEGYRLKAGLPGLEGQIYREVRRIVQEHGEEIEQRFPKVMRRVSGYNLDELVKPGVPFDLSKIAVGSEGTLCVVVEAKLRLVEAPKKTAVLACHFSGLDEAMEANLEILQTGPAAVELVDKILLDLTKDSIEHVRRRSFLQGDPQALLFVEYFGEDEGQLRSRVEELEQRLRGRGLGYAYGQALSPAAQKDMWEVRKAGLGLLMGMKGEAKPSPGVEDTCVPLDKLPEYVRRVQALMAEHRVVAEYYGHASVGVLHIRPILNLKTAQGMATLRALEDRMSDMAKGYGGAMTAEHGDGLARSEWIEKMFGQRLVGAFTQVKDAWDPQGLMNPGKIVRAPRMDENLRYDAGYRSPKVETFFNFEREGGLQQAVELCSGVGHCRKKLVGTMCPSYMATLEEEHSTRGRANALRAALSGKLDGEGLKSKQLFEVMDLCLECKACKGECPSNVDMAKLKYEFLAHYYGEHGYPLRSHLFAKIDRFNRLAAPVAGLANWLMDSSLSRWVLDRLGIDRRRHLPPLASHTFSQWFRSRPAPPQARRGTVVLFNDTFLEYNDPQIGRAATALLERAGFEVVLPAPQVCCGRPLISKGFLAQAKERARQNVAALAPYADKGWPIVGIEPSCLLSFRDDYLDLVDDPRAQQVADRAYLLEEFLAGLARKKDLGIEFSPAPRKVLVHGHCHQKALVGTGATLEVLRLAPGFEVSEIQSGCCGMAGSFGYEKEHYEVSMKVGEERLFKVVRAAGPEVEIAAVGTSCRHQIAEATGRKVRHWAEILAEAL